MDEALVSCSPTMLNTRVLLAQTMIYDEMNKTGCKKLSTTTPPTPSRPPVICHDLKHPALINNVSADPVATIPDQFVASADPSPSLDCPLPQPNPNLEHCSLFGFSHLRPFGKNTLSTCLMPGPWFLVKRPDVRVFVHNRVPRKSAVGNVAKIAQVSVSTNSLYAMPCATCDDQIGLAESSDGAHACHSGLWVGGCLHSLAGPLMHACHATSCPALC